MLTLGAGETAASPVVLPALSLGDLAGYSGSIVIEDAEVAFTGSLGGGPITSLGNDTISAAGSPTVFQGQGGLTLINGSGHTTLIGEVGVGAQQLVDDPGLDYPGRLSVFGGTGSVTVFGFTGAGTMEIVGGTGADYVQVGQGGGDAVRRCGRRADRGGERSVGRGADGGRVSAGDRSARPATFCDGADRSAAGGNTVLMFPDHTSVTLVGVLPSQSKGATAEQKFFASFFQKRSACLQRCIGRRRALRLPGDDRVFKTQSVALGQQCAAGHVALAGPRGFGHGFRQSAGARVGLSRRRNQSSPAGRVDRMSCVASSDLVRASLARRVGNRLAGST